MDPLVRPKDTTPDEDGMLRQIEEKAQGTIIELGTTPTTDDKLLETNQIGHKDEKLFANVDGTLREIAAPVAGTVVSLTTIDGDSSIEVTDLEDGYDYLFSLYYVLPSLNVVELYLRTSADNGTTYDSGAADYVLNAGTAGSITLLNNISNVTDETSCIDILVYNPGQAARTTLTSVGMRTEDDATLSNSSLTGARVTAGATNAIQIRPSSGTLVSGTLLVTRRART